MNPPAARSKHPYWLGWAIVGIPVAFSGWLWLAYAAAVLPLARPTTAGEILLHWLPAGLLAVSGILALNRALAIRRLFKAGIILGDLFVYFWMLAFIGLRIACNFGDCI